MIDAQTLLRFSKPCVVVVVTRVDTSDEILAAQHRHGARHRGIHFRERVRGFYPVGVLVRGDGVRRMQERVRAAEVRGRPDAAETEL
jgi:hypothetical protein